MVGMGSAQDRGIPLLSACTAESVTPASYTSSRVPAGGGIFDWESPSST